MNKPQLPTTPTIAKVVVPLANLLSELHTFIPSSLWEMIQVVAPDASDALQTQLVNALQRRFAGQQSRTTAKLLAHAITKQVDATLDNDQMSQITLAQKHHLATLLCQNVAHALLQTAERLTAYPDYQLAVVQAKTDGSNAIQLAATKLRRQGAQEAVENSLVNVARVTMGEQPRSEEPTDAAH